MPTQIHPTAIVSSKAQLGEGVIVAPYAIIEDDVIINDGTSIGSHAVIYNGARLGKNCKIFQGASISAPPQDLKYNNEPTTFELGDNSTIREFCTMNRGTTKQHFKSSVGSNC